MNCSRCGRDNPDGLKFCQDCGNRLSAPLPVPQAVPVAQPSAPRAAVPFGGEAAAQPVPLPPSAEKRCLHCGNGNPSSGRFCANCGAPLPGDGAAAPLAAAASPVTLTCPRCRGVSASHMAFCQYCGARLAAAEGAAPPLLAAALGPAGSGPPPVTGPAKFDPETETFPGNDKANAQLTRIARKPYVVPAAGEV